MNALRITLINSLEFKTLLTEGKTLSQDKIELLYLDIFGIGTRETKREIAK
ncbi:MAG: hypothetical protein QXU74_04010 [Candidatus Aenigmatarchaeota archaeon]|nr:hypothetical protein [Archaeoglobales archaeon]